MRPARVSPLQSATPILKGEVSMRFERVSFGSIRIDGTTYEHDVVIDRGRVRRRKKKTIQTISRRIRAHAALYRREDTLEVPSAGGGDRHRGLAGHGGSEARGSAPQNQTNDPIDEGSDQGAEAKARWNQCLFARHLLVIPILRFQASI